MNTKKKKNAGKLVFDSMKLVEKPKFIDYIRGGT